MTCREKLKIEYPDCVDKNYVGGCDGCPRDYGYVVSPDYCNGYDDEVCTKCWDREVRPDTIKAEVVNEIVSAIAGWIESNNDIVEQESMDMRIGYHLAMVVVLEALIKIKEKYGVE